MLTFTDDEFNRSIEDETGIKPSWAAESFGDPEGDIRQSMRRIDCQPAHHQALIVARLRL